MTRTQLWLGGALVVQLAILVAMSVWSDGSAAAEPRAMFPELDDAVPARIEISDTDASGPLTLETAAGGWTLPDQGGYPADSARVEELLSKLRDLEVRRAVVSSSRYHATLKVDADDFERRVRVVDDEGATIADLLLGTSPNYQIAHVRRGDDDRVYEARGISAWDLNRDSGSWVDTGLIDVPHESIVAVRVTNPAGRFALKRDTTDEAAGKWQWADASRGRPDDAKVDSLVRTLAGLKLSRPAGRADVEGYGLAEPVASVEIDYEAPGTDDQPEGVPPALETVRLALGGEVTEPDAAKGRYAARSDSEFAVVVGQWDADKIVEQSSDDLAGD